MHQRATTYFGKHEVPSPVAIAARGLQWFLGSGNDVGVNVLGTLSALTSQVKQIYCHMSVWRLHLVVLGHPAYHHYPSFLILRRHDMAARGASTSLNSSATPNAANPGEIQVLGHLRAEEAKGTFTQVL